MPFTRDDLVAYEKSTPAPVAAEPVAVAPAAPPAEPEPVLAEAPSAPEAAPQDVPVSDGSLAATAESATAPVDPDNDQPPEDAPANGKGRRNEARERIEELVAERNALRKYGEFLLQQVDELKRGPQAPASAPPAAPAARPATEDLPPTLAQHNYDPEAFAKAQNEWVQRQVDKRVADAVRDLDTRQSEAKIRQDFEGRVAEFRKAHSDYDVVISNPALPRLEPDTARLIIKSEQAPDIVYYLAKNPDVATRISRMDREQQAMAIGRLSAQLTTQAPAPAAAKPTPKPRTVTQAPPPPKPVSATGTVQKDPSTMSMDEWVAHERAKKIEERNARLALRKSLAR